MSYNEDSPISHFMDAYMEKTPTSVTCDYCEQTQTLMVTVRQLTHTFSETGSGNPKTTISYQQVNDDGECIKGADISVSDMFKIIATL